MIFSFTKNNKVYKFDSTGGIDISIPLDFYGAQPRAYGVEKASAKAYISDNFVGDIRRGGSCNFEKYTLIPHCNGTHTECIGHISDDRIFINETLKDTLVPSTLITVIPVNALSSDDSYLAGKEKDDLLIDKKSLMELTKSDRDFLEGLIIRTLPNDESKKYRDYMKEPAPFFSQDAMEFVSSIGINHLLVDIPSVDKANDKGQLSTHNIFWGVPQGSHKIDIENHSIRTITEMVYIPGNVKDGNYLLNLQIASFMADASPGRPVIFELKN